jgi:hypothetical protein
VQVNIKNLIDDAQCYQTVRELRWPDGITCPSCTSQHVIKRGFDDTEPARQRYECHDVSTLLTALAIREHFNVCKDRCLGFLGCVIVLQIDPFGFSGVEETLGSRIVPTGALTAHPGLHPVLTPPLPLAGSPLLAATVGLHHEARRGLPLTDRHR